MRLKLCLKPGFVAFLGLLLLFDKAWPLYLLLTVAVHELGHLFALQCLGVKSAALTLGLGGGVVDCQPLERRQLVIAALAGPLASVLWGLLLLRPAPEAALLSFAAGIFNLLPIPPLDGGTALGALTNQTVTAVLSALTAGTLLALAISSMPMLGWWPLLLAIWALGRAFAENMLAIRGKRE